MNAMTISRAQDDVLAAVGRLSVAVDERDHEDVITSAEHEVNEARKALAELVPELPGDLAAVVDGMFATYLALNAEPGGVRKLAYETGGPDSPMSHMRNAYRAALRVAGWSPAVANRLFELLIENGEDTSYNLALIRRAEVLV